ncbi:hypothetical protein HMPREF3136_05605 [Neisseria sp. HMSC15C08]|uniref:hypothetical protein n=1 Tax=Neisseria mucosa TaxID=488 RepID=UPI0008A3B36F|nr:hypothetical protein [Neisseria mucosa]OFV36868.1 hypothetical protein HMPREF3136_05605 [Neisseria sp. HMSC15C08]
MPKHVKNKLYRIENLQSSAFCGWKPFSDDLVSLFIPNQDSTQKTTYLISNLGLVLRKGFQVLALMMNFFKKNQHPKIKGKTIK